MQEVLTTCVSESNVQVRLSIVLPETEGCWFGKKSCHIARLSWNSGSSCLRAQGSFNHKCATVPINKLFMPRLTMKHGHLKEHAPHP